jgi:serine/threonine protein kinase
MPLPAGTFLHNRYRIVSILGQGGMGAVYRANDEHLGIPVALKENLFLTEEYSRQFQHEARILANMRHPGLPHVADYFVIDGQGQYLVMDYIEGEDLRQRMERTGPLPERDAIIIGISVLDALYHLHTRQPAVIHRDVKPGNIKVTPEGSAVLVDFGLAKFFEPNQATQTGARAMTPGYSPPEQYGTSRTDVRSDIYSLGATLYAALTGAIPEDGLNRMTGKAELTDLRRLRPKITRRLADVIERAMEVEPDDRYQTAEDFRRALIECGELATFFRERPTLAPPPAEMLENEARLAEQSVADELRLGASMRRIGRPSARVRRARQSVFKITGWVVLVLLAGTLTLTVLIRPKIPADVLAYFSNTPTSTPVASIESTPPVAQATLTPQAGPTVAQTTPTQTLVPVSVTATPTLEPLRPSPTPMGGTGELAFTSQRGGSLQIWTINSSTKQLRQITNILDGACQPTWSPDGKQMAFISPCKAKKEIYDGAGMYLINADGSGVRPLPASPEGDFDPAWSPDGNHLAFTSLRTGRPSIFLMDMVTYGVTEISQSKFADLQPVWSPQSKQIAFVRKVVFGQIWVMSEDGALQDSFSPPGTVNNGSPAWSRDGEVLFYSQIPNDSASPPMLVGMRYEDRKNAREFRVPAGTTNDVGPITGANISPDGFWIAFESWPTGNNHDIFVMTANGANITRLTSDAGLDFGPVWRPSFPR